ncbi:hypothetical protein BCE_2748 [Bacillus cereus ATCC 10987]|uniref:Uncharacterized protein n=1 Tax=Bacillus cereus (strain ATCC 10987 / NRS 248) TaxID=222523 RepID=Q737A2_BACC1|nr:hypothetical protein BCE_2748 [Bacillus cereus ATCC 10987]
MAYALEFRLLLLYLNSSPFLPSSKVSKVYFQTVKKLHVIYIIIH